MRILHALTSADPATGGPVTTTAQIGLVHREWGHTVEVVTLDDPAAPWVAQYPLKVYAVGPSRTSYCFAPGYLPWLRANAHRYDCIVVHGLWQWTGLGVLAAATGLPYFVYPHGMLDPWFKRAYPRKHLKKWLYWPWGEFQVLARARAVLFTCEEERRLARESFWLYRCNGRVVNYGTAAPTGDPATEIAAFLEGFPALRGRRIVLFLGRLHEKKGCDLLIEAFARVAHQDECLALVLAGPDQTGWRAHLEALAHRLGVAGRVYFTGMLTGALKWGALRSAEVFVLPSHQENFGIAVVEALACGVPVLISERVNIWREIVDDGAGLVEADTAEGTLSLLARWLALAPDRRLAMAEAARRSFVSRFENRQAARSLLSVLEEPGL